LGGKKETPIVNDEEIRDRLNRIFQHVFDDESIQIRDDMTADDIEEWDSLNHINLVVAVERSFRVKFTTKEVDGLANVGEFIALVGRKTA
jgi:acyl carrier protein